MQVVRGLLGLSTALARLFIQPAWRLLVAGKPWADVSSVGLGAAASPGFRGPIPGRGASVPGGRNTGCR